MEWLVLLTGGLLASAVLANVYGRKPRDNQAVPPPPAGARPDPSPHDLTFFKIESHGRKTDPMQPNHLQRPDEAWQPDGQGKRVNRYRSYAILT